MSSNDIKNTTSRYPTRRGNAATNTAATAAANSAAAVAATSSRSQRPTRAAAAAARPIIVDDDDDDDDTDDDNDSHRKDKGRKKSSSLSSSSSNIDDEDIKIPSKTTSTSPSKTRSRGKQTIDAGDVARLESITSLSRAECIGLLEAAQCKLDKAIELHFGGGGADSGKQQSSAVKPSRSNGTSEHNRQPVTATVAKSGSNKRPVNNESDFDDESSRGATAGGDDYVRAPIPSKSEKLVDYDPYAISVEPKTKRIRSVFDGYDQFSDISQESSGVPSSSNSSKMKSLAALYRPPIEIIFKGSFEASKIEGTMTNKWIMLNVQKQDDFECQCLNRDLWRDDTVKEIIKGNFIFVQIYSDSAEGKKLASYYRIYKYPWVAILDPRTGENVRQYNTAKLDALTFCEKVTEFLCENGDGPSTDAATTSAHQRHLEQNKDVVIDDDVVVEIEDDDDYNDKAAVAKKKSVETTAAKKSAETKVKKEKATDVIKTLNTSSTRSESNKEDNLKNIPKRIYDSDDDRETDYSKTNGKSEQAQVKDCLIRVMCPDGDRIEFATNGNAPFKHFVDHLRKRGFKKTQYVLIERLMPRFVTTSSSSTDTPSSSSQLISTDLSNLTITTSTNHSRNLFNQNADMSFRQLNLYPRVLLLLQEI